MRGSDAASSVFHGSWRSIRILLRVETFQNREHRLEAAAGPNHRAAWRRRSPLRLDCIAAGRQPCRRDHNARTPGESKNPKTVRTPSPTFLRSISKCRATVLELDSRDGGRLGPAERVTGSQLFEDVVDDGDRARQVHVMSVMEDVIVQNAVRAYLGQNRRSVDEHRSVPTGDRMKDRSEIRLAANRKGIEVSGDDEFLGGLARFTGAPQAAYPDDNGFRRTRGAARSAGDKTRLPSGGRSASVERAARNSVANSARASSGVFQASTDRLGS